MTFFNQYEGKSPSELIPGLFESYDSHMEMRLRKLQEYVEGGGRVMVEFTHGTRKGSIGELQIPTLEFSEMYGEKYTNGFGQTGRRRNISEWEVKFDDRKNIVKIDNKTWRDSWNCVLRFNRTETEWVFTRKETDKTKPKPEPVKLHDHFGKQLEVGQTVLCLHNTNDQHVIQFGKITRISDLGTVWVDVVKSNNSNKTETVSIGGLRGWSKNFIILDDVDVKTKLMEARLKY